MWPLVFYSAFLESAVSATSDFKSKYVNLQGSSSHTTLKSKYQSVDICSQYLTNAKPKRKCIGTFDVLCHGQCLKLLWALIS